ncbi:unnamed protein product [Closterium sp. Naga37s-1]|nr:unnamed protein product [Closterium sp. Naga37s-1]
MHISHMCQFPSYPPHAPSLPHFPPPWQYRIGQAYMRSRMQMENTRGSEGVEVVASQPFSDERMGAGHMAHVVYHFHSKAPAWLRALAPHGALCLEEQNWNATLIACIITHSPFQTFSLFSLPPISLASFTRPAIGACSHHRTSVLKCPYLTKFSITIESIHLADRGDSENALGLSEEQVKQRKVERALGLSEEQVKQRKVERVDIASHERDMWTRLIAKSGVDPSKLALPKAKRGPLAPGWQGERALFLEGHRKMYGWMDEWCELTMDDVRRIEKDNIEAMRKNLALNNKVAPDEYNEDESKAEVDGIHDDADSSEADLEDSPKAKGKAAEG